MKKSGAEKWTTRPENGILKSMKKPEKKDGPLIAAVSTPPGRGAIAIVRLSGEGAAETAAALFDKKAERLQPRQMYYGELTAAHGIKDRAVLVVFRRGASYTGEEAAEIHCHGSPVVTSAVLMRLYEMGARAAERGEFTRRAYFNGKLDLTEAEGVIDLIDSESEAAARAAYCEADGRLKKTIGEIADCLTEVAAAIGAAIDYPEEGLEETLPVGEIKKAAERLAALKDSYPAGCAAISGVNVALIGKPNAGKSTLFNALVGYERSIVTDTAGTTRDTVSEGYIYKGLRFNVIDTAGIRQAESEPERQGILRSRRAAAGADVVVETDENGVFSEENALKVRTKGDLRAEKGAADLVVTAVSGQGIDALKEMIYRRAGNLTLSDVTLTNLRQYEAVAEAYDSVEAAQRALGDEAADCAAAALSEALNALGKVTGEYATDAVIDRIFARFCVGK